MFEFFSQEQNGHFKILFDLGKSGWNSGRRGLRFWHGGVDVWREILPSGKIEWRYRDPLVGYLDERATFEEQIFWPNDLKEFCERLVKLESFE